LATSSKGEGSSIVPNWSKEEGGQMGGSPLGPPLGHLAPPRHRPRHGRRLSPLGRRISIIIYSTSSSSLL
jgi:hypothetical protein